MNKFNEVAQTVLKEEIDYYKQISDFLSKKGLKAYEYNEVLVLVEKAIVQALNKGHKDAERYPFK